MLFHVECTHGPGHLALRDRLLPDARTCRQAHLALHLSRGDHLVAGGPRVDGTGAHLLYDAPDEATLARWMHEDPYARDGVWSHMSWRALAAPVRAARREAPCLDGSRRAILVTGELASPADVRAALARAIDRGGLVGASVDEQGHFAGWFSDGREDALATAEALGLHPARRDLVDVLWVL
jgi:uncharacterized protein YciI